MPDTTKMIAELEELVRRANDVAWTIGNTESFDVQFKRSSEAFAQARRFDADCRRFVLAHADEIKAMRKALEKWESNCRAIHRNPGKEHSWFDEPYNMTVAALATSERGEGR